MMVADYRVLLFPFADTSTYGIGGLSVEIENAKNLGWSEYANDVGEAFFTINQDDPKADSTLRTLIVNGAHIQIVRGSDVVFGGWIGETDESETDVIIYAYGYVSGLYTLHTDWGTEWTSKTVSQIVTDSWTRAKTTLSDSRVSWMTTGTIENPVTTSGGGTGITLPFYRADYKRILFLMQEMAAFAISDTTNRVLFEITPSGTFNFWKNRGTDTDLRWEWGSDKLLGYRRNRIPADWRNTIYAVGSSPRDIVLRKTVQNTSDRDAKGRLEEAIYLSWVRDEDELDRVAKLRLQRAMRDDSDLVLTFGAGKITPFRATGAGYKLTDTAKIKINNGVTNIDTTRMIVGQQVLLIRGEEHVRLLMRDRL